MSNVNTPERSTYKRQIEIAVEALKVNSDLRNKELNEKIRDGLFQRGLGAPAFVSNSVLTRARNELGIKSTRGRRPGSKNHAKPPAPVPSTGIYTGDETISVYRPVAAAPSLQDLLRPVEKLMRERGISSITLSDEGLRVTRQVAEELVF
jgi:hypothetical protein